MIVSPGRRYIFVHAPKTGGTALSLALESRAMKDDILIGDTPKAKRRRARLKGAVTRGRLWKHSTLADIEGLLPQGELDAMQVVTLVRNPWDRVVSYYHWLREQTFDHPAVHLAHAQDFPGFLRHPETCRTLSAAPFGAYVTGSDGVERPTLFLRLEHLDTDLAAFEAHLGFTLSPLQRVNASNRPADWRAVHTDETREITARICARDIARFGYRF